MSSFTHTGTVDLSSCSRSCTPMPDCGGQPSPSVDSFCCVVTDLTPGTNYTVDVVAISEAGIGEMSDQQVQQTDVSSELPHSPVLYVVLGYLSSNVKYAVVDFVASIVV